MFTGIIKTTGTVRSITDQQVTVETSLASELKKGSSIAVDGTCLTVTILDEESFSVDFMPETARQTTIGDLKAGDLVNLELAMGAKDRFEGHMVSGHVDGFGVVSDIRSEDNAKLIIIEFPDGLERYVIPKGSIALNGISLTVAEVKDNKVTVSIIPHTWSETNLHTLSVGDKVNVEVDLIAKYLEKLTSR